MGGLGVGYQGQLTSPQEEALLGVFDLAEGVISSSTASDSVSSEGVSGSAQRPSVRGPLRQLLPGQGWWIIIG
jgi:hypothetical protein